MATFSPSSTSSFSHLLESLIRSMQIYQIHQFPSILLLVVSLCSFFIFLSLYRQRKNSAKTSYSLLLSLSRVFFSRKSRKENPSKTHPPLADILNSNVRTPERAPFDATTSFCRSQTSLAPDVIDRSADNRSKPAGQEVDMDYCGEDFIRSLELKGRRTKKRGKKKKRQSSQEKDGGREDEGVAAGSRCGAGRRSEGCLYPFTSSASVTQRKIKHHYDQLVKSNKAKALTIEQVEQFATCLIDARKDLQHKFEVMQRKFTITKALLFKADRSSFERFYQQIYKLETEQKRIEEDTAVYNKLQEQLKLSPAYKQMLEISIRMELQAKSCELVKDPDNDFADISFEELLAQEKRDSFWQRNGKLKSCMI